jgi:hypothetical protein
MSDGPHKSLPMRDGWKKVAQRGAASAFDAEQTAEAIPDAVQQDWQEERCDDLIKDLRRALEESRQGNLFGQQRDDKLEALKDVSGSGSPLKRRILECVTQEFEGGKDGPEAIKDGTQRAIGEGITRATFQIEEHYRLSNDESADRVRHSLQAAADHVPLQDLTERLLKLTKRSDTPPPSRNDLDDGVPL